MSEDSGCDEIIDFHSIAFISLYRLAGSPRRLLLSAIQSRAYERSLNVMATMPDDTWIILYIICFEGLGNVDEQTKGNERA